MSSSKKQSSSPNRRLTPEFFDLIHDEDPHASRDSFYVASRDFTDLHSKIRDGLARGVLLWSAALTVAVVAIAVYLSLM